MRIELIRELEEYKSFNAQEEKDRLHILEALKNNDKIFLRSNVNEHMTASGWVTNRDHTKVLMSDE